MGGRSRRKGAAWEVEVGHRFEALGVDARRNVQARFGGHDGADIETPMSYHVECKVGACPNLWAALRQAEADASEGRTPVVIAKRNSTGGGKPAVEVMVLPLDVGLRLLVDDWKRGEG